MVQTAGQQVGAQPWQVDRTVDTRGQLCPGPLIEAQRALRSLAAGQVLELLATDPGARRDIPAFARNTGHELLEVREEGSVTRFYLRKVGERNGR